MSQLTLTRGTEFVLNTTAMQGGNPFDLTGCRVLFVAKVAPGVAPDAQAVALLDNLVLQGVQVTDAVNGLFTVNMPAANTYALPNVQLQLIYEIWIKDTANDEWMTETGTILVSPRILVQQP